MIRLDVAVAIPRHVIHRTVAAHRAELAAHLEEGVQTNEVGRSATLLGGYLEVARHGLPLRVLELGASAGLNLLLVHVDEVVASRDTSAPLRVNREGLVWPEPTRVTDLPAGPTHLEWVANLAAEDDDN